MFPPGVMSTNGAVPTINLPGLQQQQHQQNQQQQHQQNQYHHQQHQQQQQLHPEMTVTTIPAPLAATPAHSDPDPASSDAPCPLEPVQEMTEGEAPLLMDQETPPGAVTIRPVQADSTPRLSSSPQDTPAVSMWAAQPSDATAGYLRDSAHQPLSSETTDRRHSPETTDRRHSPETTHGDAERRASPPEISLSPVVLQAMP